MSLSLKEKEFARSFVAANMGDCDEFVESKLHMHSKWNPDPKLDNVRNLLLVDNREGREAHARMYQRTDFYVKGA